MSSFGNAPSTVDASWSCVPTRSVGTRALQFSWPVVGGHDADRELALVNFQFSIFNFQFAVFCCPPTLSLFPLDRRFCCGAGGTAAIERDGPNRNHRPSWQPMETWGLRGLGAARQLRHSAGKGIGTESRGGVVDRSGRPCRKPTEQGDRLLGRQRGGAGEPRGEHTAIGRPSLAGAFLQQCGRSSPGRDDSGQAGYAAAHLLARDGATEPRIGRQQSAAIAPAGAICNAGAGTFATR